MLWVATRALRWSEGRACLAGASRLDLLVTRTMYVRTWCAQAMWSKKKPERGKCYSQATHKIPLEGQRKELSKWERLMKEAESNSDRKNSSQGWLVASAKQATLRHEVLRSSPTLGAEHINNNNNKRRGIGSMMWPYFGNKYNNKRNLVWEELGFLEYRNGWDCFKVFVCVCVCSFLQYYLITVFFLGGGTHLRHKMISQLFNLKIRF